MGTPETIALIIGIALTVAVIGYFVFARKHPENADRHQPYEADIDDDATGRGTLPGRVHERPAGPDAEGQAVTGRGDIGSGPNPGTSA